LTQLERALLHVSSIDELARQSTPLTNVDARAKVLACFGYLVTLASFSRYELVRPLPLLLYLAVLTTLGDIPFKLIATRLAMASPFALLVAIWGPLVDTRPWGELGSWTISAGWMSCFGIVERFVFALCGVLLLVATTGVDAVCTALGRLGLPRVLVTQLLLLYRFGFLLGNEASRMLRAYSLRVPFRSRPTVYTLRSLLGELLLRSFSRAERVHLAMQCRGFDGELRRITQTRFGLWDMGYMFCSIGYFGLVRVVDVPRFIASFVQ
jgi:cobalt/nickel transport system permease protein